MKVNYILRSNANVDGINNSIASEMQKAFDVGNQVIFDCNDNETMHTVVNGIYKPKEIIFSHDWDELHRYPFHSVDADILEKMLPYKSMAMHIMMRENQYDIFDRNYLETVYYRHLKYWNALIDEYSINCVINMLSPHHCGEYILYALAQIKNIAYVWLNPQISANGVLFGIGRSIETIGDNICQEYNSSQNRVIGFDDLGPYMKGAVSAVRNAVMMQSKERDKLIKDNKRTALDFISLRRIIGGFVLRRPRYYIRRNNSSLDMIRYQTHVRSFSLKLKARRKERKMDHLSDYKKYAVKPNFNDKYIYFALQVSPEASTMPQAGEFKNQLLSLEILSEAAAKLGVKVYVKEHWSQYHRESGYYKNIAQLPNTFLVDFNSNSIELTEHAICISTQTGNVIFESLIKKKPALVFSKGYTFKGAPNVKEITSAKQAESVIKDILDKGLNITDNDVYAYLKAMENNMIYCYVDSLSETSDYYDKNVTAKQIVDFLKDNYNF